MRFEAYQPGPPLSRFVDCFWRYENGPQTHPWERGLPCGIPELVIDLSDDAPSYPTSTPPTPSPHPRRLYATPGTVLCGPRTRPFRVKTDQSLRLLGVRFTPGGATPFFDMLASELRDTQISLEALWGAQAADLEDRLRATPTIAAQFQALEEALLAQAVRPLQRQSAVDYALQAFTRLSNPHTIAQVAHQVALSHARFIQVFREEVGLTPKQFCQVRRFLAALRWTQKGQRVNWAQLAAACGYADQAHLHRAFRRFAGVSPCVYVRERHVRFATYLTLPRTITAPSQRTWSSHSSYMAK
jgi:AraC-like DNA-binding protein